MTAGGPPPQPLAARALWSAAGQGVYAASQWGLLVALARLGSPELVGRYALALAVSGPPLLAANLQLRSLAATAAPERYAPGQLWRLRHRATWMALALAAGAATLAGLRGTAWVEALLAAAVKGVENAADLCHGVLQRVPDTRAVAAAWGAKGGLALAAFAGALAATGRLWPALVATAGGHLAILLLWEMPRARSVPAPEAADHAGCVPLRDALTLGLITLGLQLTSAAPRYLLERQHGAAALGYFSALQAFPTAWQTLVAAAALAFLAPLAELFRQDRPAYFRLTARLAGLAAGAGAVVVAAAPALAAMAGHLYRPDYSGQTALLAWLLAGGALAGVTALTGTALTAAGVYRPQAVLYLVAAGVAAAGGVRAIAAGGARGAALAQLTAGAVVAAGHGALLAALAGRRR